MSCQRALPVSPRGLGASLFVLENLNGSPLLNNKGKPQICYTDVVFTKETFCFIFFLNLK